MESNQFEYKGMLFEIVSHNPKQVVLVNAKGVWGSLTHYGSKEINVPSERILEIPEMVTDSSGCGYSVVSIKKACLENLSDTEVIRIPKSIIHLDWSFWHCRALKAIQVSPENREYCDVNGVLFNKDKTVLIAYPNAHSKCYTIPDGVLRIDSFAFKDCKSLELLYLPKTLEKIGVNAFYRCISLTDIYGVENNRIEFSGFSGNYGAVNPNCHIGSEVIKLQSIENGTKIRV